MPVDSLWEPATELSVRRIEARSEWEPCLADPEKGISFFDGVAFETDEMSDPREDRVLPVLEEEQVYMCRQMLPLLRRVREQVGRAPRILDVGTGCGVFAVWAARSVGARVWAIDVNPRALRFARENAARNGIGTKARYDETGEGEVCFQLSWFGDQNEAAAPADPGDTPAFDRLVGENKFDVVFLSPPYNPTAPGFQAALHARAGEDGQACFERWAPLVPRYLAEGGYCVGNQMALANEDEVLSLGTLGKVFDHVEYTEIIPARENTEIFLRSQYRSFLERGPAERREELSRYIKRVSGRAPQLALIYYEAGPRNTDVVPPYERTCPPDHVGWKQRMWLHRIIVESACSADSIDTYHLLGGRALSFAAADEVGGDFRLSRPLRRGAQLAEDLGLFSLGVQLLSIDTAPYHLSTTGTGKLGQASWVRVRGLPMDAVRARDAFHEAWTSNTNLQQLSSTGTYLHPQFTGENRPENRRELCWTILEGVGIPTIGRFDASEAGNLGKHLDEVRQHRKRCQEGLSKADDLLTKNFVGAGADALDSGEVVAGAPGAFGFYSSLLKDLSIRDQSAAGSRTRAKNTCDSVYAQEGARDSEREIADDFRACHAAMHEALHGSAFECLDSSPGWSMLVAVPLSIAKGDGIRSNRVPASYRGGVWVFAAGSGDLTIEIERGCQTLVRNLWMDFNAEYNLLATEAESKFRQQQGLEVISHETKSVIGALSVKWLVGKKWIPAITEQLNDLEYRIAPFPELLELTGRLFAVWGQSDNEQDIFDNPPEDFEAFLGECWKLAKAALKSFGLRGNNLATIESLKETKRVLEEIDQFPISCTLKDGLPAPCFVGESKKDWLTLTGLMVSILGNAARHGTDVRASGEIEQTSLRITVTNVVVDPRDESLLNKCRKATPSSPLLHGFRGADVAGLLADRIGAEYSPCDWSQKRPGERGGIVILVPLARLRSLGDA